MVPEDMGQALVPARRVWARNRRRNGQTLAEWWQRTGRDRLLLQLVLAVTVALAAGAVRWLPLEWMQGRRQAVDWALSAQYTPLDAWRDTQAAVHSRRPRWSLAMERVRDWLRVLVSADISGNTDTARGASLTGTGEGLNTPVPVGAVMDESPPATQMKASSEAAPSVEAIDPAAVLSPFGWRRSAAGTGQELHEGVDLRRAKSAIVTAFRSGRVASIQDDPRLGTVVQIDSPGDLSVRYAPLADVWVGLGAAVVAGQELGKLAEPTAAEPGGVHLHVETLVRGQPVNPIPILAKDAGKS